MVASVDGPSVVTVDLILAHSPQANGRVERSFGTSQDSADQGALRRRDLDLRGREPLPERRLHPVLGRAFRRPARRATRHPRAGSLMILILSAVDDSHVDHVTVELRSLGAEYLRVDPGDFPHRTRATISYDNDGVKHRSLNNDDFSLELSDVSSVWYRRPSRARVDPAIEDEDLREWGAEECRSFLHGLWNTIDGLWVPGRPKDQFAAESKIHQLQLAATLGLTVPKTVVTNDPDDVLAFYEVSQGELVTKAVQDPLVQKGGEQYGIYTRPVERRDLVNYTAFRYVPTIVQQQVPKKVELRVTVVGSRVFSAEIHSQENQATRHDWRHYDMEPVSHSEHQLPKEVETLCLKLVDELNLCFGAIDMILTPDDDYVFLEINPNGQWAWIEALTGIPIASAIANLLANGR